MSRGPWQLFDELRPEEYAALRDDIQKRGLMVPVEMDESGAVLDGHHRQRACDELGVDWYSGAVIRRGLDDAAKREHVLKANLLRRHLGPVAWAEAFRQLAEARGVELGGTGGRPSENRATVAQLAEEVGVPLRTAQHRLQAADVLEHRPDLAEEVDSGVLAVTAAILQDRADRRREERAARSGQAPPLPDGCFRTIVADPPWDYDNSATRAAAEDHYRTLSVEDIAKLDVAGRAADDAHLYLWTTNPLLREAFDIVEAWGFSYVTCLTWVKPQMGLGNYFRSATEHVLFAVRGMLPLRRKNLRNWFEAPRTEHSTKPEKFYTLVERASPGPYLEMFARRPRAGWTVWGDQA